MDPLELTYDNADAIPSGFEDLYTESDGVFRLTNVNGLQTDDNVSRLETALAKEREAHKATKEKFRKGHPADAPDLELDAETPRVARITQDLSTAIAERDGLLERERTEKIADAVREVFVESGAHESALADAVVLGERELEIGDDGEVRAREGGLDVRSWLVALQSSREHWWPESSGGGARGSSRTSAPVPGDDSMFEPGPTFNVTKQARYAQQHGKDAAQRAARRYGTTLSW